MSQKMKPQKKTASRKSDPAQSRAFIKKAREIGADEDQSEADALMGKLGEKPPEPHSKRPQPKR